MTYCTYRGIPYFRLSWGVTNFKPAESCSHKVPEVYEAEWLFRASVPKRTVDEIAAMTPHKFLESFDEDCDAHSLMITEMSFRYRDAIKALAEEREKSYVMSNMVMELEAKLAMPSDQSIVVTDLKSKLSKAKTAMKLQDETLIAKNDEIARLSSELQTKSTMNTKLISEANADKVLIDELTQQVQAMKTDRSRLITEFVPYVCKTLLGSQDVLKAIGEGISANREEERTKVLEEFQADGAVDLEQRADYKPESSEKVVAAAMEWERAEFPCIGILSSKPEASIDELLQIKP